MTRVRLGLATAALLGAMPASAVAGHLQPSVQAVMVDEGVTGAARTVRIDVSGSCGPQADPATRMDLSVEIRSRYPQADKAPFEPAPSAVEYVTPQGDGTTLPGPAASFRVRISEGIRAVARGVVDCHWTAPEDSSADEVVTARSAFTDAIQAPWTIDWQVNAISFEGPPRCGPPRGRRLKVGVGYDFHWSLVSDLRPLLGKRRAGYDDFGKIRLRIEGGGRRGFDYQPSRRGFRLFGVIVTGYYFEPRRPRPVRLWATIGGVRSQTRTIKVLPKPRGC